MGMERYSHFIDGEPRAGGAWRPVFEPASAEVYAEVAEGTESDVLLAVDAAESAFPAWAALTTTGRARWLEKLADALEDDLRDALQGRLDRLAQRQRLVQLDGLHLNDFGQKCIGRLLTRSILGALTGP